MSEPSRRELLGTVGAAGVAALAGCADALVDADDPSDEDSHTDTRSGSDADDGEPDAGSDGSNSDDGDSGTGDDNSDANTGDSDAESDASGADDGDSGADDDQSDADDGDTETGEPSSNVDLESLETIGADCGTGEENVAATLEDGRLTIEATMATPDPCHEATLVDLSADGGTVFVSMGAESTLSDDEVCTDCLGELSYELVLSVGDGRADEVVVDHGDSEHAVVL